jgi:hypothetical protein
MNHLKQQSQISPVETDDVEIETLNMEQQESVEEIDTELIQQQSTRKPMSPQHPVESIQVGESDHPDTKIGSPSI